MRCLANTAFGLESALKKELSDLNLNPEGAHDGQVFFEADFKAMMRANLYLRTAEHVYIVLTEKTLTTFDDLFETVKAVPFHPWFGADANIIVTAKAKKSTLMSERSLQSLTKKAVIESFKAHTSHAHFPETGPKIHLRASIHHDVFRLDLDTSGDALHRRGYRLEAGEAPLKETLAAGLCLIARYQGSQPLIDPFCGSGTILIEAAMIARNIPPGLSRSFAFEVFHPFDLTTYQAVKKAAYQAIDLDKEVVIEGRDMDPKVLMKAKANAERAGVDEDIQFHEVRFEMSKIDNVPSYLITNPPCDERLMSAREIDALYQSIGRTFKRLSKVDRYVLSSVSGTEQKLGLAPSQTRVLFNGPIKARYYQFFHES